MAAINAGLKQGVQHNCRQKTIKQKLQHCQCSWSLKQLIYRLWNYKTWEYSSVHVNNFTYSILLHITYIDSAGNTRFFFLTGMH